MFWFCKLSDVKTSESELHIGLVVSCRSRLSVERRCFPSLSPSSALVLNHISSHVLLIDILCKPCTKCRFCCRWVGDTVLTSTHWCSGFANWVTWNFNSQKMSESELHIGLFRKTVFHHTSLLSPSSALVLNHISSHFLIPLSDSSLICTLPVQWLVVLDTIIAFFTFISYSNYVFSFEQRFNV